jgi:hypothetical protein
MKLTKKILIISLGVIFVFLSARLIIGFYLTKDWNKIKTEVINCSKNNLIKLKDTEGNTFVFTDTVENSNLKTNNITFNEAKLGIKSLAKVNDSNTNINYLSKNDRLSFEELVNLQECYRNHSIMISNNYNFDKSSENKFCNFTFKSNNDYEINECE